VRRHALARPDVGFASGTKASWSRSGAPPRWRRLADVLGEDFMAAAAP
jgi:hypothetical protein